MRPKPDSWQKEGTFFTKRVFRYTSRVRLRCPLCQKMGYQWVIVKSIRTSLQNSIRFCINCSRVVQSELEHYHHIIDANVDVEELLGDGEKG